MITKKGKEELLEWVEANTEQIQSWCSSEMFTVLFAEKLTEHITSMPELEEEIQRIKERGWVCKMTMNCFQSPSFFSAKIDESKKYYPIEESELDKLNQALSDAKQELHIEE